MRNNISIHPNGGNVDLLFTTASLRPILFIHYKILKLFAMANKI
jgi:hypothetical protein